MSVAIITGASSGLGKEFVEAVVDTAPNVDEIWMIARRAELLQEVADTYYTKKFKVLPFDLLDKTDLAKFNEVLTNERPTVDLLINNAGMLNESFFEEQDPEAQQRMIELNAEAPTVLTRQVLPFMKRGSAIINTCSVTSFAPVPKMAIYSSTKGYLYFLTQALHAELAPKGIHVLALCPGNMRTDLFIQSNDPDKRRSIVDRMPFLNMKKMTRKSLQLARTKRAVYTPGTFYKGYRVLTNLVPYELFDKYAKI